MALPHILSLGAGVQSSTLALMAAAGEVAPMPIAAVFADTQAEPNAVYEWLEWLTPQLPFPVYTVTAGNLERDVLAQRVTADGRRYNRTAIPFYTINGHGKVGRVMHRTCTRDFKIIPIMKKVRALAGIARGQKTVGVVQWIGISLDEALRQKTAREPWCQNRWPLIELRMTRAKCLDWMQSHGYPQPPRSACWFCPFRSLAEWRHLRDTDPAAWAKAIEFEQKLQAARDNLDIAKPYLHRSCVPLDELDLRSDSEHGQTLMWDDECEGMCGV